MHCQELPLDIPVQVNSIYTPKYLYHDEMVWRWCAGKHAA